MTALEKLRFTLAQVNPTVGDLDYNLDLILDVWNKHDDISDLIIFPEMVLTGYPPEDLLHKESFLSECKKNIESLITQSQKNKSAILIGAPFYDEEKLYNAALLIDNGHTQLVKKHHLPNYGVFDERRYFISGQDSAPLDFRGTKLGVMICEDMWFPNIAANLKSQGAQILIVLNGSPFEIDKQQIRLAQARNRATENHLPLLYINQIGGQDDLVFDGTSFALSENGETLLSCKSFEDDIRTLAQPWHNEHNKETPLPLEDSAIFKVATLGLKDYMRKTGQKKVLIGLSGGIDSALVAVIAVEALGAENVHAVMMPSVFTSKESLDDATNQAKRLGITCETVPITDMVENFIKQQPDTCGIAHENLQSRLRGLILMTKSNTTGAMVLTTGNKSEMAMGYATLYGDMCGGYNPLKDIYKTGIYKICTWLNATRDEIIPKNILTKAPSAELRKDQTDQDSLPPYNILDAILDDLIEQDLSIKEIIAKGFDAATVQKVARLLRLTEYKRRQSPPGPKITSRTLSRDRRYPITNGYKN